MTLSFSLVGEGNYRGMRMSLDLLPPEVMDKIPSMKFYDDDVVIFGYPKSGKIWLNNYLTLS